MQCQYFFKAVDFFYPPSSSSFLQFSSAVPFPIQWQFGAIPQKKNLRVFDVAALPEWHSRRSHDVFTTPLPFSIHSGLGSWSGVVVGGGQYFGIF